MNFTFRRSSISAIFISSTGIDMFNFIDSFNAWLPLAIPNGNIHSYSDNLSRIDPLSLYEAYNWVYQLILKMDNNKYWESKKGVKSPIDF